VRGAVVVEDLAKSYGSVPALRGISFTVGAGEIFALLGPNGAGKTTTLEILEGFRARDAGRAEVLGLDPGERATGRELRERIGLVLQDIAVEPYLTVRETIARNAGYYPAPRGVDEVIALVGLAGQERTKVRNLSGGRKRRLDLGLGLIGDPELLFLDEPTTGFDPAARRDAWQLVRSLRDSGTTILLTTHYMEEAQALADQVAVLSDGQVVAQGTLADIGGRASAQTQIRFVLPGGCLAADLPDWARPPVDPARGPAAGPAAGPEPGDLFTVAVSEPTRALHELTSWALQRGLVLDQLTVEPPSLEDVYLRLTSPGAAAPAGEEGADDTRAGRTRAGARRADRKRAREGTRT
jgi:ABC-2 type transport system ATP-binding protein